MTERLTRRMLDAESLGLLLIAAALQVLTYGISSSLRDTDVRFLFPICIIAALLSLGLSKRHLNGIQASVGLTALGIILVWILGASLASPLLNLLKTSATIIPQVIPGFHSPVIVDTVAIQGGWKFISQQSLTLWARWQFWLSSLFEGITPNDVLVRNMIWLLVMWLISAWMGWFAARRNALTALMPSLCLLAVVTAYSEHNAEALWLMVSILLLLMGVWKYRIQLERWEARKVDYSESIRFDSGVAVFILTIIIGVFAFMTPSISWREIRKYFRENDQSAQDKAAEILGVRRQAASPGDPGLPRASMPREHLLGGGYAHSEEVVMIIRTGELPVVHEASLASVIPRYYWRSVTYDVYVGAGWFTSPTVPQSVRANTPLIPGVLEEYRLMHLDVDLAESEGNLFWTGILFSADIPFTANWRFRPQTTLFADQSALLQADMFAVASKAHSYQVDVYVPDVTIQSLRASSTVYPEFIRKRYLALPQSVPERVHQLAREIVAGKSNSYDQAKAIESYLRTYPYDLGIPKPASGRDVADYFLFDLKKGYCDYYATAMVVLARSSGLPARFVSGYAPGLYDLPNRRYVIRRQDAHSWTEIYFPEIGWVEFEPTASQPGIELPAEDHLPLSPMNKESRASAFLNQFRLKLTLTWLLPPFVIFFVALLYFLVIEKWIYMRLSPKIAIERIYRNLYRLARPLAVQYGQGETAYEFMQSLTDEIEGIRQRSRFANLFNHTKHDIAQLTDVYCKSLFSQDHLHEYNTVTALNIWKKLRPRLMLARGHRWLATHIN